MPSTCELCCSTWKTYIVLLRRSALCLEGFVASGRGMAAIFIVHIICKIIFLICSIGCVRHSIEGLFRKGCSSSYVLSCPVLSYLPNAMGNAMMLVELLYSLYFNTTLYKKLKSQAISKLLTLKSKRGIIMIISVFIFRLFKKGKYC